MPPERIAWESGAVWWERSGLSERLWRQTAEFSICEQGVTSPVIAGRYPDRVEGSEPS